MEKLLDFISTKLSYEFYSDILIKPLDFIKVTRTMYEQDPDYVAGPKLTQGDTNEASDVPAGLKRVEREDIAQQQHGIILKLPSDLPEHLKSLTVGTVITYAVKSAKPFELFKDSLLVAPFAVVGTYTGDIAKLLSNEGSSDAEEIFNNLLKDLQE
jgi:hypothetical protein